jgi:hypothetical protein
MSVRLSAAAAPIVGPLRQLARVHWPLLVVLALAAAVRVAVAVAYRPAIFFGDSWAYLDLAFDGTPVGIAPDRPSGYPLLIDLISIAGKSLAAITTAQHLAGLATGVLVYALVLRLGLPRALATAAAALVALDGYAIALEQQILSEAFFTLALVAALYLSTGRERGPRSLAAAGALLAAATTIRSIALFALPVWIVYVVWTHGRSRATLAAVTALLVPLLAYSGLHAANTGKAGLTEADGWFLYGRIGQFADCGDADIPRAALALCDRNARDRREGPAYHVWNADGPARRTFGGISRDHERQRRSNEILRQFALAIIRDRPGRYAREVAADFLRYFRPGAMSEGNSDFALTLPERGRLVRRNAELRDRHFPSYRPQVHPPAEFARDYQRALHTPRWLAGAFAAAALAALALAALTRGALALPRRRETLLLAGAALAMLLGSAATSAFVLRYLIPVVPLLVCGGLAAGADLAGAARVAGSALRAARARRAPALRRAESRSL